VVSGEGVAGEIRKMTGGRGADLVLDFVGSDATLALGASVVRMLGDLTIVGIAGGTLPIGFFSVPYEASVQTTYWGTRPELVEVLDLGARGLVKPKITTFGLDDAVHAYQQLREGRLQGRAVIVP
jgi:propanol-preferring alcohol dehydrogenase